MPCPQCQCEFSKLIETRKLSLVDKSYVRRQIRRCLKCSKRFTTIESIELTISKFKELYPGIPLTDEEIQERLNLINHKV